MKNDSFTIRKNLLNLIDNVQTANGNKFPVIFNENLLNLFLRIKGDPQLIFLFNGLNSEVTLRQFLWNHRFHFNPIKGFDLPLIYLEDNPEIPPRPLHVEKGRAEAYAEVYMKDAFERFRPTLERFFQPLAELINAGDNNETTIVGDDAEESSQEEAVMHYFINTLTPLQEEDQFARIIKFGFNHAGDLALPLATNFLSMVKPLLIEAGRIHLIQLIQSSSIERLELDGLIHRLTKEFEVLSPALSIVWCTECVRQPQSFLAVGQMDPPKSICSTCGNQMTVGSYYFFSPSLAKLLIQPDGILGLTVYWSLASSGADWAPGAYLKGVKDDTEKDAIFQNSNMEGYGIVESKVHIRDIPDRTIESHLHDDLKQLLNHYKKYIELEIPIDYLCLITNLPQIKVDECVKRIINNEKYSVIRHKLRVFTPETYEEFIKLIKEPELE